MGDETLDQPALSPAARLLAESEVARLLREVAGLTAAVVATVGRSNSKKILMGNLAPISNGSDRQILIPSTERSRVKG